MKPGKHVFWEIVLVLASVLIFRGMWLLLDSSQLLSNVEFYTFSLIVGLIIGGIAYRKLTHAD